MKPVISFTDFDKLDLRIGTIVACQIPDWSHKLLRFEVDFGAEIGSKIIFSGIKEWYTPDTFVGKQFPFIVNLPPKKMGEEESQGMMIMADGEERPILFALQGSVPAGTLIR